MMTDPASALKREVFQLIDQQIEILRQERRLTDSDLDQFRLRSGKISHLYQELAIRKGFVASAGFEGVQAVAPELVERLGACLLRGITSDTALPRTWRSDYGARA